MNMTAEQLISGAMDLAPPVRAFVAEKLIESLDVDSSAVLSPEWKNTIERRCREMDQGMVELIDADDAFDKAYAAL